MAHITLAVTKRALKQVADGHSTQRQIAIQDASPELLAVLDTASADNRVVVPINGVFALSIGDTRAIWSTHQNAGLQLDDFTSLYDLLARRPDKPIIFAWTEENERRSRIISESKSAPPVVTVTAKRRT